MAAGLTSVGLVVHCLVHGHGVAGNDQVAAERARHVVDAIDSQTAHVESVHERRRQRPGDTDQHTIGLPALAERTTVAIVRAKRHAGLHEWLERIPDAAGAKQSFYQQFGVFVSRCKSPGNRRGELVESRAVYGSLVSRMVLARTP